MTTSIEQRPVFLALVSLLPAERAEWPLDAWDIGEQEAAVTALTEALEETGTAVTGRQRARLAAVAESWGQWENLAGQVMALPAVDEGGTPCHLVEARLAPDDRIDAVYDPLLWAVCARCDDRLLRLYERRPWGSVGPADRYAVSGSAGTRLYDDPLVAFEALTARH
ncbi:hypothetical protein AB0M28_03490 [Streptomyces sp. NPDC051940]|uniref:hypothetical protein n=1 Tax=Streptomyces sp. NPDC051940 TaxID=3155675 RepID=UPI00342E1F2B